MQQFSIAYILSVDFFFCLSGFVLARSIVRYSGYDRDWLPQFLVRRFYRLWPTYLLALFLTVAIVFPVLRHQSVNLRPYIVGNLLLLGQYAGFGVPDPLLTDTAPSIAWSASVEFWVGVPFFFLIFLTRRRIDVAAVGSAILAGLLLVYLLLFSPNYMNVNWQFAFHIIPMGILRGLIGFSMGVIALYTVETFRPKAGTIAEIAVIAIILATYVNPGYNRLRDFLAPIFSVALICIFAGQSGIISTILRMKPFQMLGDASYPIYLLHVILIDVFKWSDMPLNQLTFLFYLISVVAIGYIVHVFLEQPLIRKGHRYCLGNSARTDFGTSLDGAMVKAAPQHKVDGLKHS